nr:PAS domain-containing protein [Paucibacter sp. M5-1]MCZ7882128.1 PAS domain-containing protein [Paucibacter sp. M5-1]
MLLLLALLAMAVVTTVLALRARQAAAQIERQDAINIELRSHNNLLIDLLNAETGQRGYLLTGRAHYLQPYLAAMETLDARLAAVLQLYPQGQQRQDLQRVRELVSLKLDELTRTIALHDAGRAEQARAVVLSDEGQRQMDELRRLLGSTMTRLRAERTALTEQLGRDAGQTKLWLLLGLSLLALFAALALWQVLSAGRRLKAAEQRMRSIADNVPALITQFDAAQRLVFANAQVSKVYGLTSEELLGKTVAEVRGEAAAAKVQPQIERVMQGQRVEFESSSTIAGREHHFQQSYVPDVDADGAVRGFYSVSVDISERKAIEARVLASEQGMRAIADSLPVLITYLDAQLRLRFLNATFLEWLGIDPAAALGRPLQEVIGPELFAQREARLRQALAGERQQFELCSTALGITRHIQNTYIPDQRPDGRVVGIYALSTDITPMKLAEQRLAELARSDTLTGLPNRRQFDERLALALARGRRDADSLLALLFLDIDHFKSINDGHGHGVGDAVLQQFAARLRDCVRSTDLVARLAGDEFVLVLEGLAEAEDAAAVAQKILDAMREPVDIGEGELSASAPASAWPPCAAARRRPSN